MGFRSGTLDGAGFLGIPILYFDDTTSKTEKEFARYADGKYLVSLDRDKDPADTKEPLKYERILELTRALNTFIRINNFPGKGSATAPILLDATARLHFVLALRLWIFTRLPAASAARALRPLWTKRIISLRSKEARVAEYLQNLFAAYHASSASRSTKS